LVPHVNSDTDGAAFVGSVVTRRTVVVVALVRDGQCRSDSVNETAVLDLRTLPNILADYR
jgi:hypothetical protein